MRACVLQLTVALCKWTDISMLWKERSLGWREQVKISLWIISPPDPGHCCCPHTWQRQKEMILLFQPKPVLLVYGLKEGQREGGIFWWKAGPLWQESGCVPAEKASSGRSCCSAHHLPSSFSLNLRLPFSAFHRAPLCDSAAQVQFRLGPREIKNTEEYKRDRTD